MAIKQSDLVEIVAELCRFIMFTGFFFWLLLNGATFANGIVNSLRQIGGDAAGTGQSIYPGDLITLGMQVYQQTLEHVNWLQPESLVAPIIIAVIILIVCALVAVNMILLLCAAWIVLYAGADFPGFWRLPLDIRYGHQLLPHRSWHRRQPDDDAIDYRNWGTISATACGLNQPDSRCKPARDSSVCRDHPCGNLSPAPAHRSGNGCGRGAQRCDRRRGRHDVVCRYYDGYGPGQPAQR
jgi:hypothetical protein